LLHILLNSNLPLQASIINTCRNQVNPAMAAQQEALKEQMQHCIAQMQTEFVASAIATATTTAARAATTTALEALPLHEVPDTMGSFYRHL
jgi:uncharacterized protein involved in copper resistance